MYLTYELHLYGILWKINLIFFSTHLERVLQFSVFHVLGFVFSTIIYQVLPKANIWNIELL